METSLHRALKERYADGEDGRREVVVEGFRVDAIDDAGRLVEIQSGALGPLRGKLRRLLPEHRLRIVKPVVFKRRVVRRSRRDGPVVSARCSPKRGTLVDVFDDLMGVVRVFPHSNLEIEVLGVTIDEVRVPRRRWPGYRVIDRCLGEIQGSTTLARAGDLWALLPASCDEAGTVHDLRPGPATGTPTLVRPAGRLLPSPHGSGPRRGQDGQPVDLYQRGVRPAFNDHPRRDRVRRTRLAGLRRHPRSGGAAGTVAHGSAWPGRFRFSHQSRPATQTA